MARVGDPREHAHDRAWLIGGLVKEGVTGLRVHLDIVLDAKGLSGLG